MQAPYSIEDNMDAYLQVQVVDPILEASCRVIVGHAGLADALADYYYDNGYEVAVSIIDKVPARDEAEIGLAQELLQSFEEFLSQRTLH